MKKIDELTMSGICIAILCNFPRVCGMERAMEAAEQFCAMKNELLAYRAALPLERAQELGEADKDGRREGGRKETL